MAKKRKKSNALTSTLKYEIYGILILTLSVIALAGKDDTPGLGSVGRAFSHLFLFLAGSFYFVIPLILIYIGLHVMMKRQWPKEWSYRKSGIVIFILALLILNHIALFEQIDPEGLELTSMMIMKHPFENMNDYFSGDKDANAYKQHLGGGMIGALLYGIMYFFFDAEGSRLLVYMLFAIALICLTGWSYVDLIRHIRAYIQSFFSGMKRKLLVKQRVRKRAVLPAEPVHNDQTETASPKKRSSLKKWFQTIDVPDREQNEGEGGHIDPEQHASSQNEFAEPSEQEETIVYSDRPDDQEDEVQLRIRDFQDQLAEDRVPHETFVTDADANANAVEAEPFAEAGEELELERAHETTDASPPADQETGETEGLEFKQDSNKKPYKLPALNLLSKPESSSGGSKVNYEANVRKLEATLESFGVRAKVVEVVRGPAVTRYEIQPDIGVKVSRIVSLTDDIALALAAKDIRMEAPIPGKSAIGIEVPNTEVSVVTLREVMESTKFQEAASKLTIALGRDISGQPIIADLAKMPHLLVAGATGSGKSVCVNGIISSILYKAKPDEVKFLMIDPKKVELNVYNGIPHLLAPVVTDPRRASLALKKVVQEMEKRYELFSETGTRNIEGYNTLVKEQQSAEPLPYIVVIVDELADLMMVAAGDVEDSITRLAQMARAAGIHLLIATQRPSVNVITGVIKANIPSRIAFGVSSQVDSRTILDSAGAEKLLGRGDMLFLPVGASKPVRVQGAFLSDQEVEAIVRFVSEQEKAEYQDDLVPSLEEASNMQEQFEDELYGQAVQIVIEAKQASVSLLQRRMRIGYTRAARLIDALEANGIVGPYEGSKPREVLVTEEMIQSDRASS